MQLKQSLKNADLGLTSIQITAVLADTEENADGLVEYEKFAPSMSGIVMAIFDHEAQLASLEKMTEYRQSDSYHIVYGLNSLDFEVRLDAVRKCKVH